MWIKFWNGYSDFAIKHEIRHQAGGFQLRNPIPDLFFFLGNPKLGIAKLFSWTAEIHEVLVLEISIWFSCINVNPKSGFLNLNPDVLVESALYYCTIVIGWFYSEIVPLTPKLELKHNQSHPNEQLHSNFVLNSLTTYLFWNSEDICIRIFSYFKHSTVFAFSTFLFYMLGLAM